MSPNEQSAVLGAERAPAAEDHSIFRFLRDRRGTPQVPADSLAGGPAAADSIRLRSVSSDSLPVPRFAADSLRAPSAAADSLEQVGSASADTAGVDALLAAGPADVRPAPTFRFDASWGDRAVDRTSRELLAWSTPLRTIESGNPFTPDPLDWGDLPGREPVAFLLDGVPANPPGMPEATPDPFAPSWIASLEVRPPSPLRLPNNPTGGPLLEVSWVRPESLATVSGFRLSDGSTGTNTDELYFARPGATSLFRVLWSDHKTTGRLLYGPGEGSQTLVGYERDLGIGRVALGAQHQFARQRLVDADGALARRWLWDRNAYTAGYDGTVRGWVTDLDLVWSWHRYGWEGETPARRKDDVVQTIVRLIGPGETLRPLASVQIDRHRQRYWEPGRISLDERRVGLGFAGGLGGATPHGRWEAAVGRSDPGTEEAGVVWSVDGDLSWQGWMLQGHAGRQRRARLLPRLGNHLYLQVAQGLGFPEADTDPEAEVVDAAELWGSRDTRLGRFRLGVRATRIEGAISAEDVGLARLTPDGFRLEPLPEAALDARITVLAGHAEASVPLSLGFSITADGAVRTSDPGRESQLWMAPAEARSTLGWRALLFGEALDLDLFLRGLWSGERATPLGLIDGEARLDGGGSAQVDDLVLWMLFVNLTDAADEAATVDGGPMILPIRSFRMGLTWRFLD